MATGWFQKASGVFGRRPAPPQPFELTCDCGARLSGFRTESPQKPNCTVCGATLFVLPACSLPLPASIRRAWYGDEAEPQPTQKSPTTSKPSGKKSSRVAPPAAPPVFRTPLLHRLRSAATPLRVVVVSIMLVSLLTGLVLWRNALRERASVQLQPAIDRGLEAFRKRDFPAAAAAFHEAVRALDRLGRRDAAARSVRQFEREANVAARLSTRSVSDLLHDASRNSQTADLSQRFAAAAEGQWMLFDVILETGDEDGRCRVDLPLVLGEQPVDVAFDERPWPEFWKNPNNGPVQRVIFAAQWSRLEPPGANHERTTLLLRGSDAVLWSHVDSYKAVTLGGPTEFDEAALSDILRAQRSALGLGDSP